MTISLDRTGLSLTIDILFLFLLVVCDYLLKRVGMSDGTSIVRKCKIFTKCLIFFFYIQCTRPGRGGGLINECSLLHPKVKPTSSCHEFRFDLQRFDSQRWIWCPLANSSYAFDSLPCMICKICKRLPIPPSCFVFLHFFPCLRWPIAYISHSPSRNIHLLGNTSLKKLWTFFMLCFYFLVNFYHHNHQKYQNYNYHVQGVVGVIWAMPERKCFFF